MGAERLEQGARERGAVHIAGILLIVLLLIVLLIVFGWQQHLDAVHNQVTVLQEKISALDARLKVVEMLVKK